ncbi:MAG: ribonuclease Z [Acidilobaceae archaeon]
MISGYHVEVIMLGTGATVPTSERLLPAILVRDTAGNRILLDTGEGAQVRLSQAGVSPTSIDLIAITHEHGDHVNGLPGLLQSMYINGRRKPLRIIAPTNISKFLRDALEATSERLGFNIDIIEIKGSSYITVSETAGGDKLLLHWFPVCHTVEAYGFKLEWILRPRIDNSKLETLGLKPGIWIKQLLEKGEVYIEGIRVKLEDVIHRYQEPLRIIYTGDTAPCNTVLEEAKKAKLLIHDSTFTSDLEDEAKEKGHSTSEQAAHIARESQVSLLVLTHISPRYKGLEARRLQQDARKIFKNTILAKDLTKIILNLSTIYP